MSGVEASALWCPTLYRVVSVNSSWFLNAGNLAYRVRSHSRTVASDAIPKFRSPLAQELLIGLKKIKGFKNVSDIIYLRAKFGGDAPLHGGVIYKSWVFLFFCLSVCHAVDLEQRFSHTDTDTDTDTLLKITQQTCMDTVKIMQCNDSDSDIVAICRSILMRISESFRRRNALSNI